MPRSGKRIDRRDDDQESRDAVDRVVIATVREREHFAEEFGMPGSVFREADPSCSNLADWVATQTVEFLGEINLLCSAGPGSRFRPPYPRD